MSQRGHACIGKGFSLNLFAATNKTRLIREKSGLNVITAALATELEPEHFIIRAADPGPNKTKLTKGKGTPLWMRLFYWALPGPKKGAGRILSSAVSEKWAGESGVLISDNKIRSLPPALESREFQRKFIAKCRALVTSRR